MSSTSRQRIPRRLLAGLSAAALMTAALPTTASAAVNASEPCPPDGGVPVPQLNTNAVKACSPTELVETLRSSFEGRIVVPRDVEWNLSGTAEIPLHSNVQLVGERGDLASRPVLYTDVQPKGDAPGYNLFRIEEANNVRVEGIHLRGPKPASDHPRTDPYVNGIVVIENAETVRGRGIVIADNELDLWSGAAVHLIGNHENITLEDWKPHPEWRHLESKDVGLVSVERNYMHHNVMHNGGYGVTVSGGGYGTVTGNVFDTNRHAVAASGRAYQGYVARFNYVLEGGYKQGYSYNQHFDVHGSTPSGPNKGYGGAAGVKFEIAYNTIRGEQGYYCIPVIGCIQTRPAFMLRGTPAEGATFHDNVLVHDDKDDAVALNGRAPSDINVRRILPASERQFSFSSSGNGYDKDYTREISAGDFDGDGRTDVFLAAGTGWFFSRAGIRPWEFIRASNKTRKDLALADIDNDGITDVVYRDPGGKLGYVKSGRAASLTPLTSIPVPIKDLRFGDFDGDGRTDMFYTRNKQWNVSYGRSLPRRFVQTQTSVSPIDELLFGEFDGVRGTDVAAVKDAGWMYSSASTGSYTKLNKRYTSSFTGAVAADFDGNGVTDIAYNGDGKWVFSRGGRGAPALLRAGATTAIKNVIFGRFDRDNFRTQAITYDSSGLLLVGWGGLYSGNVFKGRSTQKMR